MCITLKQILENKFYFLNTSWNGVPLLYDYCSSALQSSFGVSAIFKSVFKDMFSNYTMQNILNSTLNYTWVWPTAQSLSLCLSDKDCNYSIDVKRMWEVWRDGYNNFLNGQINSCSQPFQHLCLYNKESLVTMPGPISQGQSINHSSKPICLSAIIIPRC